MFFIGSVNDDVNLKNSFPFFVRPIIRWEWAAKIWKKKEDLEYEIIRSLLFHERFMPKGYK